MKFSVIYTSDVHGQLTAHDTPTGTNQKKGLLRLPAYLKSLDHPYLLLDNGDVLQGHVLLDVARSQNLDQFPVASLMNACGYQAMTLGNHDFNYGQPFLKSFVKSLDFPVLCANLVDDEDHPIFESYLIHQIGAIKIGILGLTTQYVPEWEKPEHIKGYHFKDPVTVAKNIIPTLKKDVDLLIVLYHGGFEKDLITHQPIGRATLENQGIALSKIAGIDILLTGHQHLKTVHNQTPIILQTPANATEIGVITVDITLSSKTLKGALVPLDGPIDEVLYQTLKPLEEAMIKWLDRPVATADDDYLINDPFEARLNTHPLFNWVNHQQLKLTGADFSATALPNDAPGFSKSISVRDIAANFVYPNTIVKLEVTGQMILDAIMQSSLYFHLENETITINKAFIYPKVEHYNYDVYAPLNIEIHCHKLDKDRIKVSYQGKPLDPFKTYTLALPSYRAAGGGDYQMFKEATIIKEYDVSIFDLVFKALKEEKVFKPVPSQAIKILKD